ncbi:MAG: 3-deoxy-D-manno-octulosonate 8-phosphate phosphatase [Myxococcales bacterium]|nr:3-deoxy-D-manno-octulosonate 8-phosphate phosphatase [Myxococcales bacterium]
MYAKTPPFHIPRAEVSARAARVKLVLVDDDGTLTDGRVYYSARGEELKSYSTRDAFAVQLLREAGIETAIVAAAASEITARRAERLQLKHVFLGVSDKLTQLEKIEAATGVKRDAIACIGDDLDDYSLMKELAKTGLVGVPADAIAPLHELAHYVGDKPGGHGAVRGFAEWLLAWRR